MKASKEPLRDETLVRALDEAVRDPGARAALYDKLRRVCGLPGPRINLGLLRGFALEAEKRGATIDALLTAMASLHEDVAPFGHVDEIFPILGTVGLGARAAADPKVRGKLLEMLEELACERTRFRVRDAVAAGLVAIGVEVGPSFADVLRRWIDEDQTFLGLAVAVALADPELTVALGPDACAMLVDGLLARVEREHRGGRRHDAYRRLCKVLETTPALVIARHPRVLDVIVPRVADDEDVRAIATATAAALRNGRPERAQLLEDALKATAKKPRDPRHGRLPGKRGRGRH
ncbi:MAG: hypothetical protein NVSMB47_18040 [Polyangiales bacterium]